MALENSAAKKQRTIEIIRRLRAEFPNPHCALDHENPYQLLIATMLSAQCTDERVNKVTPALFAAAPGPYEMQKLGIPRIEKFVQSTGFFRNKAKNIYAMSESLIRDHGAQVPETLDQLTALAGVGRKTANVVLGNAFNIPGLVVDTHVTRIANRLKLIPPLTDAVKIEFALQKLVPEPDWITFTHLFILHGRKTCTARKPQCEVCVLSDICPSSGLQAGAWKKKKPRTTQLE